MSSVSSTMSTSIASTQTLSDVPPAYEPISAGIRDAINHVGLELCRQFGEVRTPKHKNFFFFTPNLIHCFSTIYAGAASGKKDDVGLAKLKDELATFLHSEGITLPYRHLDMIEELKKCVSVALQVVGTKMHWQGTKQQMAMSMLCHRNLQKGQKVQGIDWHTDASDKTMVVLLDDATQWEGGDFEYQHLAKKTVIRLKPEQGKGVLFSNSCALHRLLPFTALKDGANRTILTLHSKQTYVAEIFT